MVRSLEARGVEGHEDLEYIYSNLRGPDADADWCKRDLEELGVWKGLLVHFGALRRPGSLIMQDPRGSHGSPVELGGGGRRGSGHGGRRGGRWGAPRGGRMRQIMNDERAERASWGNVSRPTTRAPTVAGRSVHGSVMSSRHGTVRYGD